MGQSLNSSFVERAWRALRPDFTRTVVARRIAAGFLVLLAAFAALRPDPAGAQADAVVATRDLSPGMPLAAGDLRVEKRSATSLPDGTQADLNTVVGATLAGPARRGEVLTDARLLGPRLAGLTAGPDARIVPLHLADAAVVDLIRPGDVVDVLGAPSADSDAQPRMLAANAIVVLVSVKQKTAGAGNDRVVLVALPAGAANALAGATLVQTVTLTIH